MTGQFIFARLSGETSAGNRVYPMVIPQDGTFPAVVYQQISENRTHLFGADAPVKRVRVQVSSFAQTYAAAQELSAEVEARLSRFRGEAGGVTAVDSFLDNTLSNYESDTGVYRVIQDFTVHITN
jgi:hypothetical protein